MRYFNIILILGSIFLYHKTVAQADTSYNKKEVYKKRVVISKDGKLIYDTTIVIENKGSVLLDTLNKYFFSMERDKHVYRSVWDGLDLGFNFVGSTMGQITLKNDMKYLNNDIGKSFNWKINLFENITSNDKKRVSFVSGIGYEHSAIRLSDESVLLHINKSNSMLTPMYDSLLQYTKNRIINHSLNVPVMVRFAVGPHKISPENAFQMAMGVIGCWRFASKQNVEYSKDGINYYINRWSSLNQSTFNVKATIRVAYKFIRIWAETSLMPLLNKNQGSNVYITSVGISLVH
ncbi:MAG: hypothetical protein SGJ10_12335 [Bacteroidota bacterium]|nr:hypothetical protein [Bacteroidota bacterium]